jgi:deazaflavin-dependent oxidoreductase (nitroreductase family)
MARTRINKRVLRITSAGHRLLLKLSGGRLGRRLRDTDVIVLTTTGRRSGKRRERPLIGGPHPDGWVVVASYSGHDDHPAWYLNLRAEPDAIVLASSGTHRVRARETDGEERQALWDQMVAAFAEYTEYQKVADREIPVLVLERQDD